MPYFIKDPELAECLRKLDNNFDKQLDIDCENQYRDPTKSVIVYVDNDKIYSINILKKSIEYREDYNASEWNKYPNVTPPEGIIMRVEGKFNLRGACEFKEGEWRVPGTMDKYGLEPWIERFRPWDND